MIFNACISGKHLPKAFAEKRYLECFDEGKETVKLKVPSQAVATTENCILFCGIKEFPLAALNSNSDYICGMNTSSL